MNRLYYGDNLDVLRRHVDDTPLMANLITHRTLIVAALAVALSSAFMPKVEGYGTVLFEVIVFGAWDVLALITSHTYVREHTHVLWVVAALINVLAFLIVAVPLTVGTRNGPPFVSGSLIVAWATLYIAGLFWLFPVTH